MSYVIISMITIIAGWLLWYFALPAITFSSIGFWFYLFVIINIFTACIKFCDVINDFENKVQHIIGNIAVAATCFITGLILILSLIGTPIFQSRTYASLIKIDTVDTSMIPTVENLSEIPLMDTESAKKLGDRTIGSLDNVVSQYEVSDNYTTIIYNNKVYKIAPLEYAGFFKYQNNKYNGVPGYVLVDTQTNEAKYVELEKGFRISDSAYFGNDLMRTFRRQYANLMCNEYSFQIDDEGTPYWVMTVNKPNAIFGAVTPTGVVVMNASDGTSNYYDLSNAPEWIDYIYTGNTVSRLYNHYGDYSNGFWNSLFSQKGVTHVTDDYGYIAKDNDIWIYTGVTSVNHDESNLGFIMMNSRTGECNYIKCDGAEEYSAMSAAEGVVQNYGYKASFPALITVNDEPTYALVLKDDNGLVKQYAFVNVKNYTIVTTADSLKKAHDNYIKLLNGEITENEATTQNTPVYETIQIKDGVSKTINIEKIESYTIHGETYVYLFSDDKAYKLLLSDNENAIFLKPGTSITITIEKQSTNDIINAVMN